MSKRAKDPCMTPQGFPPLAGYANSVFLSQFSLKNKKIMNIKLVC